jgi:NADP-reducing hydrogenase subunit HndA
LPENLLGGLLELPNKKTTVAFQGTPEQERQLKEVLHALKGQPGATMPALQQAQSIYGYLPIEVQKMVADGLGIHLEDVYGVSTFYSQFSLNPKGRYKVSVCLGTACYVKGAGDIFEKISQKLAIKGGECTADGKFSLEACRCIGACGLAPVMTINDEVYGRLKADDVETILKKYEAME